MNSNRMKNSFLNMISTFIPNIIIPIIGFLKFSLIVKFYGSALNGLLQVFAQLLSLLQMSELGFSTAFNVSFYEPLACKNKLKVNKIYNGCKQFQKTISLIMLIGSLLAFTILPIFTKGINVSVFYASAMFFSFSLPYTVYQYFNAKYILIRSMQKEYIFNKYYQSYFCVRMLISTCLIPFLNFSLYILIDSVLFIFTVILSFKKIDPYLKDYISITDEIDRSPAKMTKYVLFHRISSWVDLNTDNLVLSSSSYGVISVSIYNSYMYIVNTLNVLVGGTLMSCIGSFGDLIARAESYVFATFKQLFLLTMFLTSIICISTYYGASEFVGIWLHGADYNYTQSVYTVIMIVAILYYRLSCRPITIVLESQNLFRYTAFGAALQALVNLSVSLFLVSQLGISGVLLGTLVSLYLVDFIFKGYYGMKMGLHKNPLIYFSIYSLLTIYMIIVIIVLSFIKLPMVINFSSFIIKMVLTTSLAILILFPVYYYSFSEFRNLMDNLFLFLKDLIKKN